MRSKDLNEYALGLGFSAGQNPYADTERYGYFYPFLTSLEDATLSTNWLLANGNELGGRLFSADGDWELGVQGRVQTMGFGPDTGPALDGVRPRGWTLESGLMAGWRGGPVQVSLKHYWELLGRHSGTTQELRVSYPHRLEKGYLVPYVAAIRQSSAYARNYYGIELAETAPDRPTYRPGSVLNWNLGLRLGYRVSEDWLVSGSLAMQFFDEAMTDSPLIDRDRAASASVGVAYNRGLFRRYGPDAPRPELPRWELELAYVDARIDSLLRLDDAGVSTGRPLDGEAELGQPERDEVLRSRLVWRIGHYHRFDVEYLRFERQGVVVPSSSFALGSATVAAGSPLRVRSELSLPQVSYGYSFVRDAQKEAGVSIGVHVPVLEARFDQSGSRLQRIEAPAPLPVVGAYGRLALRGKLAVRLRARLFGLQVDTYEGAMTMVEAALEYEPTPRVSLMLGFVSYRLDLRASADDFQGRLRVDYRGPQLAVGLRL
ncbi:MAG: MipA/OmpV family protein [Pseudomonadales bacterium]|nr:MipA/OmpV family protein [Pseudomonadales bacterium]